MISFGAVAGGPECSFFLSVLQPIRICAKEERIGQTQSAEINVVFHLPGSIADPGYTGVRTAKFSKRQKTLMMQIGVEKAMVACQSEAEIRKYIQDVLLEAITVGESWLHKRGIAYDAPQDLSVLERCYDAPAENRHSS